ncbi:MAG: ribonuclease E/G [Roseburia sp.]|nr:ribonuclease E/G [Roseburia sp.]
MSALQYVLTKYQGGILSFSSGMETNRFESVTFTPAQQDSAAIGDIFVAKVITVAVHMNAVFIDYRQGAKGYLPFRPSCPPVLLNRRYDGSLRAGDELLVQLEKEAVRTKEPVFTANLSLAGKYCVVTSGNTHKSVSKKCDRETRALLADAIPKDTAYGIVVRTNAASLLESPQEDEPLRPFLDECARLIAMMERLLREGIHKTCYSRIYKAAPSYLTYLRDTDTTQYQRIVTDDEALYRELLDFSADHIPELSDCISLYTDASYPLQKLYSVQTRLQELTSPRVWLKSGAYLVIEKTEALYVIDVNSGKNISKKNAARYFRDINLEAAAECMRQIRLRNLSGIILIDFINMEDDKLNEELLRELRALAGRERIQTTVVDMTPLGLVEITRSKKMKALAEQLRQSRPDNP